MDMIFYNEYSMSNDLHTSLLSNHNRPFHKLYEQCAASIQKIKLKNDFMQKQIGKDLQDTIKTEVMRQKQFLENQILQAQHLMRQIAQRFKDPQSKAKLKSLKTEAFKQTDRNKLIMKDIINKSFLLHSNGGSDYFSTQDKNLEEEVYSYDNYDKNKESLLTDRSADKFVQENVEHGTEAETKILIEKRQLIDEVERSNARVNQMINDLTSEVNGQGENLGFFSGEILKREKHKQQTSTGLQETTGSQNKSCRKCAFLTLLIFIVILIVLGLIYALKRFLF